MPDRLRLAEAYSALGQITDAVREFRQIAETGGPVVVVLMGVAVLTLAVAIYKVWQFWRSAVGRHKALTEAAQGAGRSGTQR